MPKQRASGGKRLRAKRIELGMSMRDVQKASMQLAKKFRNRRFIVPASRLHGFERSNTIPSVYRFYTLSRVYGCKLNELLGWYGVPAR